MLVDIIMLVFSGTIVVLMLGAVVQGFRNEMTRRDRNRRDY